MSLPLLLLHGALGAQQQMHALKSALSSSLKLHAFDFSGHGEQAEKQAFGIKVFANDVLRYLDEHKLEKVNIFGYSMGGYVGLYLAKHHPARVNHIICLGTKMAWTPAFAAQEIKMLNPDAIEAKVPKFAQHLARTHGDAHWKEVVRRTAHMMFELGEAPALQNADFAAITHPVHICRGDQDKMVSPEESENVSQLLPNGQFHSIPETPHQIERVNMEELVRLILSVLAVNNG